MRATEIDVDLSAPVGRVWTALSTSYGLRSWWWRHWDDVHIAVDGRVGGEYRITADAAGILLEGVYTEVDRPAGRLAFTWEWSDRDGTSAGESCEISLSPREGGCRITLRHRGPWASSALAAQRRDTWIALLEQLRAAVERPALPPVRTALYDAFRP